MLSILDAVRDTLPETRTYHVREFIWIPADEQHPEADGRLGNLTLKLQFRRGTHRKFDLDSYAVELDTAPDPMNNGGAAFWLVNLTDKEQDQPYRCVVGGLKPRCTCKASQCQVRDDEGELVCKHYSALKHLTESGYITANVGYAPHGSGIGDSTPLLASWKNIRQRTLPSVATVVS